MSDRNKKRAQFEQGKKKSLLPVIVIALVLLVGGGFLGWQYMGANACKYPLVSATGGQITIPVAKVSDGQAHFFSFQDGQKIIDFFVLKSEDGVIRAALDTCDVCYREKKGYRQEGNHMVCNNCDQKFRSNMINEAKGGCNPAPLNRTVQGDQVVIAAADLLQGAWYFEGTGK
ncbi:hypothetical protein DESUT3_25770 [Desulfuromonas versatilis]|uniref:Membrane iron-sulfur containing protein FtrD-like domain-containing protein n=1 Tax=Desulfuromonas versatilis TaxID=2802975 RepID=A0ABN6DZH1_9BACT|nr:DUF2318 domain-containing protein [Desulfuromonas versatilis]BCR05508.1 hypothetical protein DESUT3_25770 [Desulfuromonas versatilis]